MRTGWASRVINTVLIASITVALLLQPYLFAPRWSGTSLEACEWFDAISLQKTFHNGDRLVRYEIMVDGDVWTAEPYGWHATAYLARGSVEVEDEMQASGLAYLNVYQRPFTGPSGLFADRPGEALEYHGYPHVALGPEQIELIDHRRDFSMSDLSGEVKLYNFIGLELRGGHTLEQAVEPANPVGLLSVLVSDGCADFSTTLAFQYHGDILPAAASLLEELQTDIQITVSDLGPAGGLDTDE